MNRLIYLSCLVFLAALGCATAPSQIPPPSFPSESSASQETRSAIFRSQQIHYSGGSVVKVGNKFYPLGDLPDYYHDSEFSAASKATHFREDNFIYGILMIGGFVGMDLLIRNIQQPNSGGSTGFEDVGAGVGVLFGLTWIIAALPSDPKDYIQRYNNYLGNRLGVGWDDQGH